LADPIFAQLVRLHGFALDEDAEHTWKSYLPGLRPEHILRKWPAADLFKRLRTYAFRGIAPSGDTMTDRERAIEEMLDEVESLFAVLPKRPSSPSYADARRLSDAANARWALDNEKSVNPAGLAALGGLSPGRGRNLMSEGRFGARTRVGGVGHAEAERWLRGRPKFRKSRWREMVW